MFCTLRKYFLERSVDIILKASIPKLREKLLEALQAVLPIVAIVLVLCFSIAPVSPSILLCFLLGAAMIIVGIMFFTLGAEMSMSPMGERVGAMLTKSRSVLLIIGVGFLLGFLITISEPDLQVLANQVPSIPNMTLILSVAAGVGLFLVVAFLRMLLGIALPKLLVVFYGLIFVLAAFVPKEFLSVAFDSGGVTTGPITVPFIMALGVGVAAIRSDRHAADDSFGLVALCSIGPILAVLILGIAFQASDSTYVPPILPNVSDSVELWHLFHEGLPTYIKEIATSLLPIIAMFGVFQLATLRLDRRTLGRIGVGLAYGFVLVTVNALYGFLALDSIAQWKITADNRLDWESVRANIPWDAVVACLVIYIPGLMAVWFAPLLASEKRMSWGKAVFYSFFGCLRNIVPVIVLLVLVVGVIAVFGMLAAALVAALGASDAVISFVVVPLSFLVLTVIYAVYWPMYASLFEDVR